jgi:hypothetical protein
MAFSSLAFLKVGFREFVPEIRREMLKINHVFVPADQVPCRQRREADEEGRRTCNNLVAAADENVSVLPRRKAPRRPPSAPVTR